MNELLDEKVALGYADKYLTALSKTGFVSGVTTRKTLAYLFLVDFVETLYEFLDETDYRIIGKALTKLFTGGGCLLPYPVFCDGRAKLGSPSYMGGGVLRRSEGDDALRISQDFILRGGML